MKTKEEIEERIEELKVIRIDYIRIMSSMVVEAQYFAMGIDLKCIDNRIDELEGVLNIENE
jgi:hypothetical protein